MNMKAIKARMAAYDEALEAMKEEGHTEENQQIYQLARVKFTTHSFPDIDALVKRVEELEATVANLAPSCRVQCHRTVKYWDTSEYYQGE